MFFNKSKKAFTLIELLVTIFIIGSLVAITVISINDVRSKTWDAKRVASIKQIQTALQSFFIDKGRYPTTAEFAAGSIFSTSTNNTTTYMSVIPLAPNPPDNSCSIISNQFLYYSSGNITYTIDYCLGDSTGVSTGGK